MILNIFGVILTGLAALGIVWVVEWLCTTASAPHAGRCLYLLPVYAEQENLEQLLRWSYGALRWDRWLRGGRLILLDVGVSVEQRAMLSTFCEERVGVALCDADVFASLLKRDGICKTCRLVLYC